MLSDFYPTRTMHTPRLGVEERWRRDIRKWRPLAARGDAMVDYAYCLQHGAGVRRDLAQAEEIYRRAIESDYVTEAGREEARYLLSVILLRDKSGSSRREAVDLLLAATAYGDYPVAQRFLEEVAAGTEGAACTCRRYLRPGLARRYCGLHRPAPRMA